MHCEKGFLIENSCFIEIDSNLDTKGEERGSKIECNREKGRWKESDREIKKKEQNNKEEREIEKQGIQE